MVDCICVNLNSYYRNVNISITLNVFTDITIIMSLSKHIYSDHFIVLLYPESNSYSQKLVLLWCLVQDPAHSGLLSQLDCLSLSRWP